MNINNDFSSSERQQSGRIMEVEDPERPYSDVVLTISARFAHFIILITPELSIP